MYGFMADHAATESYYGSQQLTAPNIGFSDWAATANGGPYVNLDGATEALYVTDAAWQEATTDTLFVWHWCNPASLAATIAIASKYDTNGNNCSWLLHYATTANFRWLTNAGGVPAGNITVTSTYAAVAIDTWYFVAGYFQASTLMRIWVGAATDDELTVDSLVVAVPANVFNGSAPLGIGTAFNNAPVLLFPWNGLIGGDAGRISVPAASINGYAARLFHLTRYFYR